MNYNTTLETKETVTKENKKQTRTITPFVNQYKTKEGIVLVMDLPGVNEKNLEISFEKDSLVIRGESEELIQQEELTSLKEFSLGPYYRKFIVGNKFDQEKTKAVFKNGRLILTLVNSEPTSIKVTVKSE
ncbi:MAG: Hsp20/alpha crystallin family protein [Leptospiraceae bacterium]|nr:Hsp20/alpha crystallin family protein [Leptospiraceae bacterium]